MTLPHNRRFASIQGNCFVQNKATSFASIIENDVCCNNCIREIFLLEKESQILVSLKVFFDSPNPTVGSESSKTNHYQVRSSISISDSISIYSHVDGLKKQKGFSKICSKHFYLPTTKIFDEQIKVVTSYIIFKTGK